MTAQAVEAAVVAGQQKQQAKQQQKQAQQRGAGPEPKRKTGPDGTATFRGEGPRRKGGPRAVSWAWSGSRKVLTAQFVLCAVILVLGTLTSSLDAKKSAARSMVKGSALALLFFLLALLSSAGGSSARAATAMGTLITVAYAVTSSDVHALVKWVGHYFGSKAKTVGAGEEPQSEQPEQPQGDSALTDVGSLPG